MRSAGSSTTGWTALALATPAVASARSAGVAGPFVVIVFAGCSMAIAALLLPGLVPSLGKTLTVANLSSSSPRLAVIIAADGAVVMFRTKNETTAPSGIVT